MIVFFKGILSNRIFVDIVDFCSGWHPSRLKDGQYSTIKLQLLSVIYDVPEKNSGWDHSLIPSLSYDMGIYLYNKVSEKCEWSVGILSFNFLIIMWISISVYLCCLSVCLHVYLPTSICLSVSACLPCCLSVMVYFVWRSQFFAPSFLSKSLPDKRPNYMWEDLLSSEM